MRAKLRKKGLSLIALTALFLPIFQSHAAVSNVKLVTVDRSDLPPYQNFCGNVASNGKVVVFGDYRPLLSNDTNSVNDIFVRDFSSKTKSLQLVSINDTGTFSAQSSSTGAILSDNGRFVVFQSTADNLVSNDHNQRKDIFIRDLSTGKTSLVTVNKAGQAASISLPDFAVSYDYDISADGRFVVFTSYSDELVANDNNGVSDVFVYDTKTMTTKLVSINRKRTQSGDFSSTLPTITANGRFVTFTSYADDLVANDKNDQADQFLYDLKTGKMRLLEADAILSPDGLAMLFVSDKPLATNDTNNERDIYLTDFTKNKTQLVSINTAGKASGNGASFSPAFGANGRAVMFSSWANDLVSNADTNGQIDVFVRDLGANKTQLVSVNKAKQAVGGVGYKFSSNGQTILFTSKANKLAGKDANNQVDLFIRDLETNRTTLLSRDATGVATGFTDDLRAAGSYGNMTLSADGKFAVFSHVPANVQTGFDLLVTNVKKDQTQAISEKSYCPSLGSDDRTVVFTSADSQLLPNSTNNFNELFAYKIQ